MWNSTEFKASFPETLKKVANILLIFCMYSANTDLTRSTRKNPFPLLFGFFFSCQVSMTFLKVLGEFQVNITSFFFFFNASGSMREWHKRETEWKAAKNHHTKSELRVQPWDLVGRLLGWIMDKKNLELIEDRGDKGKGEKKKQLQLIWFLVLRRLSVN